MPNLIVLIAAGWGLTLGIAQAGERVSAAIDLNIRSGPGAKYAVTGRLRAGRTATSPDCGETADWCEIEISGQRGWVYAKYLSSRAAIPKAAQETMQPAPGVDATATTGSIGPGDAPATITLSEEVRKYVATHRPLSIRFDGEPSVGASFPHDIRLRDIPGSPYQYVYVSDRPVFVDRQSRRIVHVGADLGR